LNKKTVVILVFVLILFAAFAALTQEAGFFSPSAGADISAGWVRPAEWFRSNAGGMALEESQSSFTALRNEYALAVIFAHHSEVPDFLLPYYDDYLLELRRLYKNGIQIRTQWILKDSGGNIRVNAVFSASNDANAQTDHSINTEGGAGFIEIFDSNSLLLTEYRYFENGAKSRVDYEFNDNHLISSVISRSDSDDNYIRMYADSYRYNRSSSLRAIERVFYNDMQPDEEPFVINFPGRLMETAGDIFISERINVYPDFFGDAALENNKIVYETDERGRVLSQTFYDERNNVIWVIQNTWQNNRITSTLKNEDGVLFLAEYEYSSDGDKLLEKNYRNGVLERIVRSEGNFEYEELYINNIMVMTAVWEDGRKISESRAR